MTEPIASPRLKPLSPPPKAPAAKAPSPPPAAAAPAPRPGDRQGVAAQLGRTSGPAMPAFDAPAAAGKPIDVPQKASDYAAYNQRDLQRRGELAKRIQQDPKLMDTLKRWEAKDPKQRPTKQEKLEAGQAIANHHAAVYGTEPPKIALASAKSMEDAHAEYDDASGKITLNEDKLDKGKDFVDTIAHESTHHHQAALAKQYEAGQLKPGDVDYAPARSFAKNDQHYVEADDSESGGKPYLQQPVESHAWATGAGVANRLYGPGKRSQPLAPKP